MLKVLFVNPYYFPYLGGVEKAIDQISSNLLNYNLVSEVSVLTTYSKYPVGCYDNLNPKDIYNGANIYRLNFYPKDIPSIYHSYNAGYYSPSLYYTLNNINPDIVHYCKTEWFFPNLLIFRHLRDKAKHVFFSSYHQKPIKKKHMPMILFNRYFLRKVDKIHVPSLVTARSVSETFGINIEKISVIPLGSSIRTEAKRISSNSDRVTLIIVGRLDKAKGQYDFLVNLLIYGEVVIDRIKLVLVGRDSGDLENLRKLVASRGLKFVEIFNDVNDAELERLYEESDIFVLPSLYEAFGLAIVDAMSYSLPVVAFDQGAIREITHGNAILVEGLNWKELISKIVELIDKPEIRSELGERSRRFVESTYSWKKTAEQIAKIYKDMYRRMSPKENKNISP